MNFGYTLNQVGVLQVRGLVSHAYEESFDPCVLEQSLYKNLDIKGQVVQRLLRGQDVR